MDNINRGKIVFGIALKVFEELLQDLQEHGIFGSLSTTQEFPILEGNDELVISGHVHVALMPVQFRLKEAPNGVPYTALILSGKVKVKVSSPTAESPNLFDLPFTIHLKITPILKSRANKAPVLGLSYQGIDVLQGPIPVAQIDSLIQSQGFAQLLNNFELDILEPAIAGLEEVLFLSEDKPNRADWAIGLHLLEGNGATVDSLALIVDVPGGNVAAPSGGSFVPLRAEIIAQITEGMVQGLVEEAREELRTWFEDLNGVNLQVTKLNLSVANRQLFLDAEFDEKEYDAEVTMKGPIKFHHSPGSMQMQVDIRQVAINVDLPWWADFLVWLVDVLTLGTIGVGDIIHNKIPNFAQNYAQKLINQSLLNLGQALSLQSLSYQGVDLEVYPDLVTLEDGAITAYIQVLNKPIKENLMRADYSKLREKFVIFELQTGRRYLTEDLARFMKKGLVHIHGYHHVDGRYIRSNPDNSERNNLEDRYGR